MQPVPQISTLPSRPDALTVSSNAFFTLPAPQETQPAAVQQ